MNGTGTNGDKSGSGFGSTSTGGPAGLGNSTLTSTNGSPIGSTGPIIGVASIVTKESIREYEKQKHYNEWEFVYNPQTDLGGLGGNTGMGIAGQNGASTNAFGSNCGSSSAPASATALAAARIELRQQLGIELRQQLGVELRQQLGLRLWQQFRLRMWHFLRHRFEFK